MNYIYAETTTGPGYTPQTTDVKKEKRLINSEATSVPLDTVQAGFDGAPSRVTETTPNEVNNTLLF
jgi:hypothetical protein